MSKKKTAGPLDLILGVVVLAKVAPGVVRSTLREVASLFRTSWSKQRSQH